MSVGLQKAHPPTPLVLSDSTYSTSAFVTALFLSENSGHSSSSSHALFSQCTVSWHCNPPTLPSQVRDITPPVRTPVPPYIWLPTPHTVTRPFPPVPRGDDGQRQGCRWLARSYKMFWYTIFLHSGLPPLLHNKIIQFADALFVICGQIAVVSITDNYWTQR